MTHTLRVGAWLALLLAAAVGAYGAGYPFATGGRLGPDAIASATQKASPTPTKTTPQPKSEVTQPAAPVVAPAPVTVPVPAPVSAGPLETLVTAVTIDGTVQYPNDLSYYTLTDGAVLVPLKSLMANLGWTTVWDDPTRTIHLTGGTDGDILLAPGVSTVFSGGVSSLVEPAPQIINGHTYVPQSFFSTFTGYTCEVMNATVMLKRIEPVVPAVQPADTVSGATSSGGSGRGTYEDDDGRGDDDGDDD